MDKSNFSKNYFIISLLPAFAYWYLEANYSIRIAVIGGMGLALIEVISEKIFVKHVHSISKMMFFLMFILGGLSLIKDDGVWFKLQPALTGVGICCFIGIKSFFGKGPLQEMMEEMNKNHLPEFIMKQFEIHIALFFGIYGLFMGILTFQASTDWWLFFKTGGFYIISAFFLIFEIIIIRYKIKKLLHKQHKKEALRRF